MINGLKNLKDFQREITLLNIEKLSWARPPQKVQRKKGQATSFERCFLIVLNVECLDIEEKEIEHEGKCSKKSRAPCKVEFQGM